MKGKLIKTGASFILKDDKEETLAITGGTLPGRKLLLKNCQATELGYDLNELSESFAESKSSHPTFQNTHIKDFKKGFQKAVEILGDKKFSEEDMHQALHLMNNLPRIPLTGEAIEIVNKTTNQREEIIKSLQQKEWDVEIVEQCLDPTCDGVNRKGECITTGKPKLDADGCLILKRL